MVELVFQWRCGEDFCDACGDCLHCYGDDPCPDGGHWYAREGDEQSYRLSGWVTGPDGEPVRAA